MGGGHPSLSPDYFYGGSRRRGRALVATPDSGLDPGEGPGEGDRRIQRETPKGNAPGTYFEGRRVAWLALACEPPASSSAGGPTSRGHVNGSLLVEAHCTWPDPYWQHRSTCFARTMCRRRLDPIRAIGSRRSNPMCRSLFAGALSQTVARRRAAGQGYESARVGSKLTQACIELFRYPGLPRRGEATEDSERRISVNRSPVDRN
jgi:hypothetical protein